ncbi:MULTISPECIES: DUF3592 domain-containing protein [unclassified Streptomyces]|uniref:DUF3592 domain-containing protein n=1 Tax=unclassified Streptomyces TaxID=2593676 RepID=UPI002DDB35A2|nr:DUF3592 domain-containing protein [Streptomyces sp. NBC_01445]WSE07027.1 hypothetical protein OG574_29045 [Streptomyces sp. NBC_01445]
MDAVFHILFPVLILVLVWAGYAIVRRSNERQAAWQSGLTARARVVRAYVTVQVVNNIARRIQWHEYDFTTADRRAIRFKESGGPPSRAAGDEAVVYYTVQQPDKATASEPSPGKDAFGMIFGLVVIVATIGILINVMVQYG